MADPVLVPLADRSIGVELVVVLRSGAPPDVLVHPAEIMPVVGQGHDELDPQIVGFGDRQIQVGQAGNGGVVVGRGAGACVQGLKEETVSAGGLAKDPHADDLQIAVRYRLQNLIHRWGIRIHQRIGIGAPETEGRAFQRQHSIRRLNEIALAPRQRSQSSQK